MKEGWTYRKLGNFIKEYSVRDKGQGFPVYSVTNTRGFCQEFFGKNVASADTSNYKVVPRGCFAYNPSRINVGSVACQDQEDYVSVSPLYVVFSVSPALRHDYLLYYIKSNYAMTYINALARGAVRNNLRLSTLKEFDIPLPSVDEQKQIVSELDLLSDVIEKQKVQIEELDKLAQSTFYDMFGDPSTNEKGWDFHLLGDLSNKITDGVHAKPVYVDNGMPFISVVNINKGFMDFDNCKYVSQEDGEIINKRSKPEKGDILYTKVGATYGIPALVDSDKSFCLYVSVCLIKPKHDLIDSIYLKKLMELPFIKFQADKRIKGIGVPDLHLNQISSFIIPLPPLALQQEYAAKIEAIEQMKAKVRQSLKESEELFNSRMDYYFN